MAATENTKIYNFACAWPIQANLVSKYTFSRKVQKSNGDVVKLIEYLLLLLVNFLIICLK